MYKSELTHSSYVAYPSIREKEIIDGTSQIRRVGQAALGTASSSQPIAHVDRRRSYGKSMLPTTSSHSRYSARLEGKEITFLEERISGDGDCGFTALGITRKQLSRSLLGLEADIGIRSMLADEVYEAFITDHLSPTPEWEDYYYDLGEKECAMRECLSRIRAEIKELPTFEGPMMAEQVRQESIRWLDTHGYLKQAKKLRKADVELNEANRKIGMYCQSPEVYHLYCRGYLEDLWLGCRSALIYAEQQKINLYIWQKSGLSGELVLKGHHSENSADKSYHLLFNGVNHFDRLLEQPSGQNEIMCPLRSSSFCGSIRETVKRINTHTSIQWIEFISRILIERTFFQNDAIPPQMLLHLANDLIRTISPQKKECFNMAKEVSLTWKQIKGVFTGESLTPEEKKYQETLREIDWISEVANGLKYSTMALIGQNLFTSLNSTVQQGLWSHVPAVAAYAGLAVGGYQGVSYAVDQLLDFWKFPNERKTILKPWLELVGRLALGFVPKVHANEQGVHYQYPSMEGSRQTTSATETTTIRGDTLTVERKGTLDTPEGEYDGVYEAEFKLKEVYELSREAIRVKVVDKDGRETPIEFTTSQGLYGPEVKVSCENKNLERHWAKYFRRQPEDVIQPISKRILSSYASSSGCSSGLVVGGLVSLALHNPLPAMLTGLSCVSPVTASVIKGLPETKVGSFILDSDKAEQDYLFAQKYLLGKSNDHKRYALLLNKLGNRTAAEDILIEKSVDRAYWPSELQTSEGVEIARERFIKETLRWSTVAPTHYEYAVMSALVYYCKEHGFFDRQFRGKAKGYLSTDTMPKEILDRWEGLTKKGWYLDKVSIDFEIPEDDYFGVVFVNNSTKNIVIAHRGVSRAHDLDGSVNEYIQNEPIQRVDFANALVADIRAKFSNDFEYVISITGHSLGGIVAQHQICDKDDSNVLAITFDTPGMRHYCKKNQQIVSYLSSPNIINTFGSGVGEVRAIRGARLIEGSVARGMVYEVTQFFLQYKKIDLGKLTAIVDETYNSHNIEGFLSAFDSENGREKNSMSVIKWPTLPECLTYLAKCTGNMLDVYHPRLEALEDSEVAKKLAAVHRLEPLNRNRLNFSYLSQKARDLLTIFTKNRTYYENFSVYALMLFRFEKIGGEEYLVLKSDPRIFNIDDFRSYIESKTQQVENCKKLGHELELKTIYRTKEELVKMLSQHEDALHAGLRDIAIRRKDLLREINFSNHFPEEQVALFDASIQHLARGKQEDRETFMKMLLLDAYGEYQNFTTPISEIRENLECYKKRSENHRIKCIMNFDGILEFQTVIEEVNFAVIEEIDFPTPSIEHVLYLFTNRQDIKPELNSLIRAALNNMSKYFPYSTYNNDYLDLSKHIKELEIAIKIRLEWGGFLPPIAQYRIANDFKDHDKIMFLKKSLSDSIRGILYDKLISIAKQNIETLLSREIESQAFLAGKFKGAIEEGSEQEIIIDAEPFDSDGIVIRKSNLPSNESASDGDKKFLYYELFIPRSYSLSIESSSVIGSQNILEEQELLEAGHRQNKSGHFVFLDGAGFEVVNVSLTSNEDVEGSTYVLRVEWNPIDKEEADWPWFWLGRSMANRERYSSEINHYENLIIHLENEKLRIQDNSLEFNEPSSDPSTPEHVSQQGDSRDRLLSDLVFLVETREIRESLQRTQDFFENMETYSQESTEKEPLAQIASPGLNEKLEKLLDLELKRLKVEVMPNPSAEQQSSSLEEGMKAVL